MLDRRNKTPNPGSVSGGWRCITVLVCLINDAFRIGLFKIYSNLVFLPACIFLEGKISFTEIIIVIFKKKTNLGMKCGKLTCLLEAPVTPLKPATYRRLLISV